MMECNRDRKRVDGRYREGIGMMEWNINNGLMMQCYVLDYCVTCNVTLVLLDEYYTGLQTF